MKCAACGYKHGENDHEEDVLICDDTDEFTKIEGHFTRKSTYWNIALVEVRLYACPKCGTVIMAN